jgi:hypothetical protein
MKGFVAGSRECCREGVKKRESVGWSAVAAAASAMDGGCESDAEEPARWCWCWCWCHGRDRERGGGAREAEAEGRVNSCEGARARRRRRRQRKSASARSERSARAPSARPAIAPGERPLRGCARACELEAETAAVEEAAGAVVLTVEAAAGSALDKAREEKNGGVDITMMGVWEVGSGPGTPVGGDEGEATGEAELVLELESVKCDAAVDAPEGEPLSDDASVDGVVVADVTLPAVLESPPVLELPSEVDAAALAVPLPVAEEAGSGGFGLGQNAGRRVSAGV